MTGKDRSRLLSSERNGRRGLASRRYSRVLCLVGILVAVCPQQSGLAELRAFVSHGTGGSLSSKDASRHSGIVGAATGGRGIGGARAVVERPSSEFPLVTPRQTHVLPGLVALLCAAVAACGLAANAALPLEEAATPVTAEERRLRHTTPAEELKTETWWKKGRRVFLGNCATCHGTISAPAKLVLSTENLKSRGYEDPEKIRYVIRYGIPRKMAGFAADCPDEVELPQCASVVPLSEEALQDVQDYMLNRANFGWKSFG